MKKWKAWVCLIAIFLAGAVLGGIIGHRVTLHVMQRAARDPVYMRQMIVKRLTCKLDLKEDQRKSIESIIADSQVSIRDLRSEVEPRFTEIVKNAENQIQEVLDAKQQQEFRRLIAERRKLWQPAD